MGGWKWRVKNRCYVWSGRRPDVEQGATSIKCTSFWQVRRRCAAANATSGPHFYTCRCCWQRQPHPWGWPNHWCILYMYTMPVGPNRILDRSTTPLKSCWLISHRFQGLEGVRTTLSNDFLPSIFNHPFLFADYLAYTYAYPRIVQSQLSQHPERHFGLKKEGRCFIKI